VPSPVPLALPSVAYFWKKCGRIASGTAPWLCTCSSTVLPAPASPRIVTTCSSGEASTAFLVRLASSE
jgi:hypothetical protein